LLLLFNFLFLFWCNPSWKVHLLLVAVDLVYGICICPLSLSLSLRFRWRWSLQPAKRRGGRTSAHTCTRAANPMAASRPKC
jgi:hypothetical protein